MRGQQQMLLSYGGQLPGFSLQNTSFYGVGFNSGTIQIKFTVPLGMYQNIQFRVNITGRSQFGIQNNTSVGTSILINGGSNNFGITGIPLNSQTRIEVNTGPRNIVNSTIVVSLNDADGNTISFPEITSGIPMTLIGS